jgi:hypothetical protein
MDIQQMIERLLTAQEEMRANQAKAEAKLDAYQEKAEIGHKESLSRLEDDRQAEQRFLKDMMQLMDTSHKEIMAEIKPRRDMETMACQEMEARLEEPTSVDRKPEVAQQREAPVNDAEVMPVGELKRKRRRDQKLAAEPEMWTPEEIGRRPQRNDPPCESGTAEGKLRWEKTHQAHG